MDETENKKTTLETAVALYKGMPKPMQELAKITGVGIASGYCFMALGGNYSKGAIIGAAIYGTIELGRILCDYLDGNKSANTVEDDNSTTSEE
ncbi:MAG: hypothetical protein V1725_02720 [archaeon]